MEFRQLQYFCAVAAAGGFSAAAVQQRISQPSLSVQIRNLEEELGVELFDRRGRPFLTEAGKKLLPHAHSVLRQVDNAKLELRAGQVLALGATPSIAGLFLPPCLYKFRRRYPDRRITVLETGKSELLDRIYEGALDIAFCTFPGNGNCSFYELFREALYLVVPENHAFAHLRCIDLAQIGKEPFLVLKDDHHVPEGILIACRRARVKLNIVFESLQLATILGMVAEGLGISIVPRMATTERIGCRFIPLSQQNACHIVGVVRSRSRALDAGMATFLEYLGIAGM